MEEKYKCPECKGKGETEAIYSICQGDEISHSYICILCDGKGGN